MPKHSEWLAKVRQKVAKIENLIPWLLGFILLFIPLYPKFPLFNISQTFVAVRIEDLLVASTIFLWFLSQWARGFPLLKERTVRLIALYWAIGALSLVSALLITKNVIPHLALLHYLRRIEYMTLFLVALSSVKRIETAKKYGLILFLATVGVTIYGVGQKFWGWPVVSTMNREFSKGLLLRLTEWARVNSTFAGHYDLAAYLVLILALVAAFVFGLQKRWQKITVLMVGFASFYILILTASRISFAAYLVSVTFVLLGLKQFRWLGPVLACSLVLMLLSDDISQRYALTFKIDLSAVSSRIMFRGPAIAPIPTPTFTPTPTPTQTKPVIPSGGKTLSPTPTPTPTEASPSAVQVWRPTTELAVEYSNAIRFKVEWPRALRALAKNPLMGTGYSSVTLATDNDYLRTLAETGLLGFWAFGLIFLEIGRKAIFFLKRSSLKFNKAVVIGLLGAAVGLFANGLFIDVFESSKVAFTFWVLMGIMVAITNLEETRTK